MQPLIPILTGKNYEEWAIKMRTLLRSHDVWELVAHGYVEPTNLEAKQALTNAQREKLRINRKKDAKALSLIQNGLDGSIFPKISAANFSKVAWDILESNYQGITKVKTVKLQTLRMNFENLKMKELELVDQYITHVMNIVNQLRMNGEEL